MIDTDHNQNAFIKIILSQPPQNNQHTESGSDQFTGAQAEMPRYKCHKEVHALKIDAVHLDADVAKSEGRETNGGAFIYPEEKGYAPFKVDHAFVAKHNPEAGGYYVVYEDGYKSFSPAKAFEDGYARI